MFQTCKNNTQWPPKLEESPFLTSNIQLKDPTIMDNSILTVKLNADSRTLGKT